MAERFADHLYPDPNSGCWLFIGAENNGYGEFEVRNKNHPDGRKRELARRLSWMLAGREIPGGLCLLHKCDTPLCCNPDHLFLGTRRENQEDMAKKGRGRQGARFPYGVSSNGRRYAAGVPTRCRRRHLGTFDSPDDAAAVAAKAKVALYSRPRDPGRLGA